jgi:histone-lysine N-methyltransferase SETD2
MFTKQDVKKGQFIIEYVGEVLDDKHYQKRMMQYDGERHYYFLSLAANQTIDASRRGNNARFINHSCNPNCQLQVRTRIQI